MCPGRPVSLGTQTAAGKEVLSTNGSEPAAVTGNALYPSGPTCCCLPIALSEGEVP